MSERVIEYQDCESLVIAEVIQDDSEAYVTGAVENLCPLGQISKNTAVNSATKFYDGQPKLVVRSEGADTIGLTVPVLTLDKIAKIIEKYRDPTTGVMMDDGKPGTKYFAIGYKLKFTDGTYRYVWRLKGSFQLGEETVNQIGEGTDTTNQTITYTGIQTTHKFTYPDGKVKPGKAVVADEADDLFDLSDWFSNVKTPDSIPLGKVATPVISLASGAYEGEQSVNITCATSGASVYYTTDGKEPTVADTLVSGAVTIPEGETTVLKAKAFKAGLTESNTAMAWYVVAAD